MPKLRVHNLAMSLDGFVAGADQGVENPLGVDGERLHGWMFETKFGRAMIGEQGGDSGVETTFELELRPGTQSGAEQVLRGRGVPGLRGGRGDLIVAVVVETPRLLDPRQEELLRELAAIRGEEEPTGQVRPASKSVFGRLRDAFNPH